MIKKWEWTPTQCGNELYHYGVLGMHWGVRKAARAKTASLRKAYKSSKNQNRKEAKKAYKEAYKKAKADVKKTGNIAGYDKGAAKRYFNQSKGKKIAQLLTLGSYGTVQYNKARSKGQDRLGSYGSAVINSTVNRATLGLHGHLEKKRNTPKKKKK